VGRGEHVDVDARRRWNRLVWTGGALALLLTAAVAARAWQAREPSRKLADLLICFHCHMMAPATPEEGTPWRTMAVAEEKR
jgi:hypothetical protein